MTTTVKDLIKKTFPGSDGEDKNMSKTGDQLYQILVKEFHYSDVTDLSDDNVTDALKNTNLNRSEIKTGDEQRFMKALNKARETAPKTVLSDKELQEAKDFATKQWAEVKNGKPPHDEKLDQNTTKREEDRGKVEWTPPDFKKLTQKQIIALIDSNDLRFALCNGSGGTVLMKPAESRALDILMQDDWSSLLINPDYTFRQDARVHTGSEYSYAYSRISFAAMAAASYGGFSGSLQTALSSANSKVSEGSFFYSSLQLAATVCKMKLKGVFRVRKEVEAEFKAVFSNKKEDSIKQYAKLNRLFSKYGFYVVTEVDLGVMGAGEYKGTAWATMDTATLSVHVQANMTYTKVASGSVKTEYDAETERRAKDILKDTAIVVKGATMAVGYDDLRAICAHASNWSHIVATGIRSVEPLYHFFEDQKLREQVAKILNNPWEIKIFSNKSASAQHPECEVVVEPGYICVGGGARVDYGNGYGNLLTASFPKLEKGGNTLVGWQAKSKDHGYVSPATLEVYAIGIKATSQQQPDWKVECFTKDSACVENPEVALGGSDSKVGDYLLFGGGAQDQWSGGGNLLFVSAPVTDATTGRLSGWTARGKDHKYPSSATITCYAYGVAKKSLGKYTPIINVHAVTSALSQSPHVEVLAKNIIGGGAKVDYGNGEGQLLTASYPDASNGSWKAVSKPHESPCSARLTAYALSFDIIYKDDAD